MDARKHRTVISREGKQMKQGRKNFLGCNPEFGEAEIELMGPIEYFSKNEKVIHRVFQKSAEGPLNLWLSTDLCIMG